MQQVPAVYRLPHFTIIEYYAKEYTHTYVSDTSLSLMYSIGIVDPK